MPIDLNHTDKLTALMAGVSGNVNAKLFSKDLTGTGHSKIGYFNENYHTLNDLLDIRNLYDDADDAMVDLNHSRRGENPEKISLVSYPVSDQYEELTTPLSWLDFDVYRNQFHLVGDVTDNSNNQKYQVYVTTRAETMTKIKQAQPKNHYDYKFSVRSYVLIVNEATKKLQRVKTYLETYNPQEALQDIEDSKLKQQAVLLSGSAYAGRYADNDNSVAYRVAELFNHNPRFVTNVYPNADGKLDTDLSKNLQLYIGNTNIVDVLKSNAMELSNYIIDDFISFVENFKNVPGPKRLVTDTYYNVINEISYDFAELETKVDNYLDASDFTKLYQALDHTQSNTYKLPQAKFNRILTHSLRLLLAKSLSQLQFLSDNGLLHSFEPKNEKYKDYVKASPNFSEQQKALILTTYPLTVGTAGAGSGKSHTLIGRLAYLNGEGEDLKKTLVLSFTNTAADNIKNRYPNVNSITLGNLFNQMYQQVFPTQELSADDTVINSLYMVNVKDNPKWNTQDKQDHANLVRRRLISTLYDLNPHGFQRGDHNAALSELSQIIADEGETVTDLLNMIQQTTLEIEPVMIYNMILAGIHVSLPKEYKDIEHIITDESQDISTFEYILLTTLTAKYRADLMIMGDGTQTLYEFRSSNPQFLNAIEASGIFKAYQLTTNYRSNGSILTYANQFLAVIDANKYAHLKLEPNSLEPVTLSEFKSHVQISDYGMDTTRGDDYVTELGNRMASDPKFKAWLKDKIANHEQVAFMAFTRMETKMISNLLEGLFSSSIKKPEVVDITPVRTRQETKLSEALGRITRMHQHFDLRKYANEMSGAIQSCILDGFRNKAKAFVPRYVMNALNDTFNSNQYRILRRNAISNPNQINKLNRFVRTKLLRYEIRYNAINQLVQRDSKDDERKAKAANADIIISTIHSAKGLEFDNTVVIYNEAKRSATSQASLRLYGVALTRAKNNEYIINVHAQSKTRPVKRVITSDQADMFSTPMMTAQLRCEDDLTPDTNN